MPKVSQVTRMNESWHTGMNESRYTNMNQSRHTCHTYHTEEDVAGQERREVMREVSHVTHTCMAHTYE